MRVTDERVSRSCKVSARRQQTAGLGARQAGAPRCTGCTRSKTTGSFGALLDLRKRDKNPSELVLDLVEVMVLLDECDELNGMVCEGEESD